MEFLSKQQADQSNESLDHDKHLDSRLTPDAFEEKIQEKASSVGTLRKSAHVQVVQANGYQAAGDKGV